MKNKQKLRFGLPKGSLQEATIEKMAKAGFNISVSSRSYIPYVDDDELEIRLIRAQDLHKNQSAREERIAASIGFERAHDRRFVYDARFAFTTVLPGKYHLKAIWDKRAPHSDTNSAGPGDYETFVSPQIIVKAGATVTNLLFCTNRIAGGEAYYRADELFAEKWVAENPPAPPPSPPRRYPVEADHEIHR